MVVGPMYKTGRIMCQMKAKRALRVMLGWYFQMSTSVRQAACVRMVAASTLQEVFDVIVSPVSRSQRTATIAKVSVCPRQC